MKSIVNGHVYVGGEFHDNIVVVYDEVIHDLMARSAYEAFRLEEDDLEETDAMGLYVMPGFIDVHVHGYKGKDTMDGDVKHLKQIAEDLTENGVTAFLPTTMTMPMAAIEKALKVIREVKEDKTYRGALVLGAHLEGPFINESKKGAQSAAYIRLPEADLLERYKDIIEVVTIAPEVDGAFGLIDDYKEFMKFSIGHSAASYEEAMVAYERGACGTTHLFNAMTGLHHRQPGIVGAALTCDCYAEVIADNFHINPAVFNLLVASKGLEKLLLITDCMRAGGLEEGAYDLGGQEVTMKQGQCLLANGTIAGSVLAFNQGLKNFTDGVTNTLKELVPLVSENQARYLGIGDYMGTLTAGKLANIVLMEDDYTIGTTIVKGQKVYVKDDA